MSAPMRQGIKNVIVLLNSSRFNQLHRSILSYKTCRNISSVNCNNFNVIAPLGSLISENVQHPQSSWRVFREACQVSRSSNLLKSSILHINNCRSFCTSGRQMTESEEESNYEQVKLMDFRAMRSGSFMTFIRTQYFLFLVKVLDNSFNVDDFLAGAQQSIVLVSRYISEGSFERLDGLISNQALPEIRHNYSLMSPDQRRMLCVNIPDILRIGVINCDMLWTVSDSGDPLPFIDLTVTLIWNCRDSLGRKRRQFCDYRFHGKCEKPAGITDWTIDKLNHWIAA